MKGEVQPKNEKVLFQGVLWLNSGFIGLALGVTCGLAIFIATNWLVIKGGDPVGPNLQLLSQYFIGYRVSFFGSIIGFVYGFAVGTFGGTLIGWIYNRIAGFKYRLEGRTR